MADPVLAATVGLAAALILTPAAMAVARRTGAVDRPGPLKVQTAPVPHVGGAAVFVATAPWVAWMRPGLLAPLGGALALGMADDFFDLSPWLRLAGQVAVGIGIAALVPTRLGEPWGGLAVAAVSVLLINGVNLIDGLDGLASGVVATSCLASAVLLGGAPRAAAAAAVGALAAFLVFNRPPARVYLGDGGSCFLGALLAVLLASAWGHGHRSSTAVAALALAAVPAAEVAFAVLRRLRARGSVVAGDRRHPYDLLVRHGWRPARSALAYVGAEAVLAGAAVLTAALHSVAGAGTVSVVAAGGLLAAAAACGWLRPEGEAPA